MSSSNPIQLLLAISGMSPQVITETLYGIATRIESGCDDRWPEEIRIITTKRGKDVIQRELIKNRWISKVCLEVNRPIITLREDDIFVVPDAHGNPVDDARSADDHDALANYITTTVRDLTAEVNEYEAARFQIHASIAGGRKTMTFYLGYAISLFGRHFDQMSHVLVSDGFEGATDFFFPTKQPCNVTTKSGVVCASRAKVTLADIPFLRMRHSLPELLTKLGSNITYRQLVSLINLGDQPECIRLHINTNDLKVLVHKDSFSNESIARTTIRNPVYMAFYLLFVEDTMKAADQREIYSRPTSKSDNGLMASLLVRLERLLGCSGEFKTVEDICSSLIENHGLQHANLERTLTPLLEKNCIDRQRFNNYLTNIQDSFKKEFPGNLISMLLPSPLYDGTTGEVCSNSRNSGGRGYGVRLKPFQIRIT